MTPPPSWRDTSGFTLLEAVIAMALMAMILAALATITGQWLPNWNRGVARIQANEQIARALERLSEDLSAAEFVAFSGTTKLPLFEGLENAVTFVRTAVGPNTRIGLDVVRVAEVTADNGSRLVRTRAPFAIDRSNPTASLLTDPVVLLRSPYRVTFSFAGSRGEWSQRWQRSQRLPSLIKITLRNAATGSDLNSVVRVYANLPAECASAKSAIDCWAPADPSPAASAKKL